MKKHTTTHNTNKTTDHTEGGNRLQSPAEPPEATRLTLANAIFCDCREVRPQMEPGTALKR